LFVAFINPAPSSSMNASHHLLRTIQHTQKERGHPCTPCSSNERRKQKVAALNRPRTQTQFSVHTESVHLPSHYITLDFRNKKL
jgi:hypothetical protein